MGNIIANIYKCPRCSTGFGKSWYDWLKMVNPGLSSSSIVLDASTGFGESDEWSMQ